MDGLFPIIRRVRRSLMPRDEPPVVAANVEPVNAVASPAQTATEANHVANASTATVSQEEAD